MKSNLTNQPRITKYFGLTNPATEPTQAQIEAFKATEPEALSFKPTASATATATASATVTATATASAAPPSATANALAIPRGASTPVKKRGRGRPKKGSVVKKKTPGVKKHRKAKSARKGKSGRKDKSARKSSKMRSRAKNLFGEEESFEIEPEDEGEDALHWQNIERDLEKEFFHSSNRQDPDDVKRYEALVSQLDSNCTSTPQASRAETVSFMKEFEKELRYEQARNLGECFAKGPRAFLSQVIKDSSMYQYESNKRRVEKAGFAWSTSGLFRYFGSTQVARTVGNTSCLSTLSTFKLFYSIEHLGKTLPANEENLLRMALRVRRRKCPDFPRTVGAINRDRLAQLHQFYAIKSKATDSTFITESDLQELYDASTMMYACALRIFQLRSLTSANFDFVNDEVCHVTVTAKCQGKGQNGGRMTETKLVHPDFIAKVQEIVNRRKQKHLQLFLGWSDLVKNGKRLDRLMRDCNEAAANAFGWPCTTAFHGTHNFRHGAAQDAYQEGETKLVMFRTGHVCDASALHYARTDLERHRTAMFSKLSVVKRKEEIRKHLQAAKDYAKHAIAKKTTNAQFVAANPVVLPILDQDRKAEHERKEIIRQHEQDSKLLHHSRRMTGTRRGRTMSPDGMDNSHRKQSGSCPKRTTATSAQQQQTAPKLLDWDLNDTRVVQLRQGENTLPFLVPKQCFVGSGWPVSHALAEVRRYIREERERKYAKQALLMPPSTFLIQQQ